MLQKIDLIGDSALKEVQKAESLDSLEKIRVSVLGKKGALSEVLKSLGTISAQERPKIGALANQWKQKIDQALQLRKEKLEEIELDQKLNQEKIDTTLPSLTPHSGALHPLTQTTRKILQVFQRLGFDVTTGPEVETEFLNFESVNIPQDHPARDMQDTFFLGPGVVLRTHTSPVQMRTMMSRPWPIRVLCPGAVYRVDSDATHSPMFHQVEGLWIDKNIRMSDLKGVLEFFAREIFGPDAKIRFRPSYFPFVEPGVEVDVSCDLFGKGAEWLEILGAGMVHPKLFESAGYDAKEVSGFAFGMGVDRIAMLLHKISDIRLMFQGDIRFLNQFSV